MLFHLPTALGLIRDVARPGVFSIRRALFVLTMVSAVCALHWVVRISRLLDRMFFWGVGKQPVGQPVYIVAAARSGTTFLHRLMAMDTQFSTMKLADTLVPSLLIRRALGALGAVDRRIGAPFARWVGVAERRSFSGWSGIHETGLSRNEEDEGLWVLMLLSPAVLMMLPQATHVEHACYPDRLPAPIRSRLVGYYRSSIQRQLYGTQQTLLAKNVLIQGRLGIVTEACPDVRYVRLVRHPYQAIPSMLSLFTAPWRFHSPDVALDGPEVLRLAELAVEYYLKLEEPLPGTTHEPVVVRYDELISDTRGTVQRIYAELGLPMSDTLVRALDAELANQGEYRSTHKYNLSQFGLSEDWIYQRMEPVFKRYGFPRTP